MDDRTATELPIHDLLRQRYSPRAFSERVVSDETLCVLFEAARWAPSCANEQPWRFIVASRARAAEFQAMAECLVQGNRVWAEHAAVLCISVAATTFAHNGQPNRHAWYDVGQAAALLTVQATSMGLHVHQMAGFDTDMTRERYVILETFAPVTAMAIGYLGDPDALPEPYRTRERNPRERKPLSDLVHAGSFGTPFKP